MTGAAGARSAIIRALSVPALVIVLFLGRPSPAVAQTAGPGCPLCDAAKAGDLGQSALLLDRGADVNATDTAGVAPLGYALANEKADEALYLLKHGAKADIALPAPAEQTRPLMIAVYLDDPVLAQALIRDGAQGPYSDPLATAAGKHQTLLVQVFLDTRPDEDAASEALSYAIAPARIDIARGATEASRAALSEALPTIRLLLGAGAAPNRDTLDDALEWADYGNDTELLDLFLAHGARLEALSDQLPLAEVHDEPLMRRLVDAGVNPDMENAQGDSALNVAAEWGDVDQVRKLLDLGANIDHVGHSGAPIAQAISSNNEKLFTLLLRRGADLPRVLAPDEPRAVDSFFAGGSATPGPIIRDGVQSFLEARRAAEEFGKRLPEAPDNGTPLRVPGGLSVDGYQKLANAMAPMSAHLGARALLFMASLSLSTELAIPGQARDHMAIGLEEYQAATTRSALLAAALEFEQASQEAPWIVANYRDLCVIDHLAGAYARAMAYCRICELAGPPDAPAIDAIVADSKDEQRALSKPAIAAPPPAQ